MRKTTFWAAFAGALMLVGIAGRADPDKHALAAQTSTDATQLDAFQMMLNAKHLPSGEFEDFSVVFSSPVTHSGAP